MYVCFEASYFILFW